MKANYHTHTMRCHHAIGSDEDYVKSAIAAGFDELGFSDHSPWNYQTDFVSHMRMKLDKFQDIVYASYPTKNVSGLMLLFSLMYQQTLHSTNY